uniref:Uncharacterized protein n=1 Tax=Neobodo designis TaxID=312471 RepID=A0A7S1R138_NEODS|mmetsp:Transcript_6064/g.19157  ORF Transcript_6064/g.19157 Transcript_6064/m.19157 type:complete len:847 (+) Transcript_6064:80-2620(+)
MRRANSNWQYHAFRRVAGTPSAFATFRHAASVFAPANLMSMVTEIKKGVVNGVPFHLRVEAETLLDVHLLEAPNTSKRYHLVVNTAPAGAGKSTLLAQNMLRAAEKHGCVVFGLDFNGGQQIQVDRGQSAPVSPKNALGARILASACPELEWDADVYTKLRKDFAGFETMPLRGIIDLAKKKVHCEHLPAFLAVDELLKMDALGSEKAKEGLSDICAAMDRTLVLPDRSKHVYACVSVYDIVDVSTLTTKESKRPLLHQPLPPLLPVLFAGDKKSAVKELELRVPCVFSVINESRREEVRPKEFQAAFLVLQLLRETWGHPRRVEKLFDVLKEKTLQDVAQIIDEEKKENITLTVHRRERIRPTLEERALARMNNELRVKDFCTSVTESEAGAQIRGLFEPVPLRSTGGLAADLREATLKHYQLVPSNVDPIDSSLHVGYLPMVVADTMAEKATTVESEAFRHIAAACEAAAMEFDAGTSDNKGKSFENIMHRALPLCFFHNLDRLGELFSKGGTNVTDNKKIKFTASGIEWLPEGSVDVFPVISHRVYSKEPKHNKAKAAPKFVKHDPKSLCRHSNKKHYAPELLVHDPKSKAKGLLRHDKLLERIMAVGSGEGEHARKILAFKPSHKYNLCCDHCIVVPHRSGGRTVFLLQEKDWFQDTLSYRDAEGKTVEKHVLAEFRWAKQHFSQRTAFPERYETGFARPPGDVPNPFRDEWEKCEREGKGKTHVIFTLVTANPVMFPPVDTERGELRKRLLQQLRTTDERCKEMMELLGDEACIDLKHMERWCPTVAFDAFSSLKVRSAMRDFQAESDAGNTPRESPNRDSKRLPPTALGASGSQTQQGRA